MVIVTGATGHIGANLVRALVAEGRSVRALIHDDASSLDGLPIERVSGDVRDPASLALAFEGAEIVYHLAAKISITGDPDGQVHATNVTGTRNVAEAALAAGVNRMVHFSSCHAFDLSQEGMVDETTRRPLPCAPTYDRSKAAGEAALREVIAAGLDAVIVNPTGVVGPEDYEPSRMGQALLDLRDRKMPALVAGGFDFVDVRDVVAGAMAAEKLGKTGENYLLGGQHHVMADFLRSAADAAGVRAPRFVTPMWVCMAVAPFMQLGARLLGRQPTITREGMSALASPGRLCTDKARRELGYQSRPMSETLADTFRWWEGAAPGHPRQLADRAAA